MTIAHGGIGDEDLLLPPHPLGEAFRPQRIQLLLGAPRNGTGEPGDDGRCRLGVRLWPAACLGMAVDGDVGEIVEQLGGAVLALHRFEQRRRRIDELRGVAVVAELRVIDDRLEEGEVRRDAANAELAQRAVHARDRLLGRRRPSGYLLKQRVVETRDHRAGIGGAAVQPYAEAGRPAIGGDAAVVGDEVLLRVFGGDSALQRMAVEADVLLGRHAALRRTDGEAVEDVDLRLDDVDAGHLLGDGVFDLDARIDFDEVEFAGIRILKEFDRAGADIGRVARELQRIAAQLLAQLLAEIGRRRALDHFLVAPLDRAIALEQMHGIAMRVAQHLHFDVPGALDQLFQVDFVLAEGCLRLAFAFGDFAQEVCFAADGPHAATTTAPRGFQHNGVADFRRQLLDDFGIVRQRVGRRHDRHAHLDRQIAGGNLVAQPAHGLRFRTDEGDTVFGAGLGEFRTFRQKPIAGMDRVRAREPCNTHDLVDREIAFDRTHVLGQPGSASDLIALVRLEAMQGVFVLLRPDGDCFQSQAHSRRERRGWRFQNDWRPGF